jgi:hypothetical protein
MRRRPHKVHTVVLLDVPVRVLTDQRPSWDTRLRNTARIVETVEFHYQLRRRIVCLDYKERSE